MQFSTSNKSSWAHKFHYPVLITVKCAGIGRQLHPLKAKDLMKDRVIEIDWKYDMRIKAKQSKTLELTNLNIPW